MMKDNQSLYRQRSAVNGSLDVKSPNSNRKEHATYRKGRGICSGNEIRLISQCEL